MPERTLTAPQSFLTLSIAQLERLSDEQILLALQDGHSDALTILFDRYHRLIYSVAFKIVRHTSEAEDVMQNVFFEIFRSAAQFDPAKGTCKVWLLQYAYHRAINRRQQLNAKKFYHQASIEDSEPELRHKENRLIGLAQGELKHLIRQGLATLNAKQKRVIELASYEGLTMSEISSRTGDSLVSVRHQYYRGLAKLRSTVLGLDRNGQKAES